MVRGLPESENLNVQKIYCSQNNSFTLIERLSSDGKKEFYVTTDYQETTGIDGTIGKWVKLNNCNNKADNYIPEECNVNDIKMIRVFGYSIYFIMNDGTVWACGNKSLLGLGDNFDGNPKGFINLAKFNLPKIKGLYNQDEIIVDQTEIADYPVLQGENGKIYLTGRPALIYGTNILQQNWFLMAKEVKCFNAGNSALEGGVYNLCYVDTNNDLWALGDSRKIGIGSTETNTIKNFIRVKDYLDDEHKKDIDGNVKMAQIRRNLIYVLTLDNKLLVAGVNQGIEWPNDMLAGVGKGQAIIPYFTEILDNVVYFTCDELLTYMLTSEDDGVHLWFCGYADGNSTGGNGSAYIPTDITSTVSFNCNDICRIFTNRGQSWIILDSGEIYVSGSFSDSRGASGLNFDASKFTKIEQEKFNNEKIIDVVSCDSYQSSVIFLTENGNLYASGMRSRIGIGDDSNSFIFDIVRVESMSKITKVSGGFHFFIAVDDSGRVYGTGDNSNGVLGRWKGTDRNLINSRYRTAFEFVECPDIEI